MSSSRPFRLLTISEAAEYLAISERSVKRLIARGDLDGIRSADPQALPLCREGCEEVVPG